MINKMIKYKTNIIYCIGILAILSLSVLVYSGVKEGYFKIFLLASIIAPMLIIIRSKNNMGVDLGFAALIVLIILLYAIGFWAYKDRLPTHIIDISQVSEESRGGLFSFENSLRVKLLFVCSTISTLISLFIRLVLFKFRTVKS
jgi:hypothetical protein